MFHPSRKSQQLSLRGWFAAICRSLWKRAEDDGRRGPARRREWLAGSLLCLLLVGGISLVSVARERSPKNAAVPATTSAAPAKAEREPARATKHSALAATENAASSDLLSEEPQPANAGSAEPAPKAGTQEQENQNSSAAALTPAEEQENPELMRERAAWFHDQRAYPFKHIPAGALQRAIEQRDEMKARQRAASLQSAANAIISFPGDALWHLMGPQPVNNQFGNQSFGLNGGFPTVSGRVTAIAVDPSDATGNTAYIGGAAGGVWKTTNGGTSWTPLTDAQPSLAVGSIAIDPNSCSPGPCTTVYVGTGEENFNGDAYYGAGVLKSTDGGVTWTQLGAISFVGPFNNSVGAARIGGIAVDPNNSSVILAAVAFGDQGSPSGIYRSADGGTTWTQVVGAAGAGDAGTGVVFDPVASAKTAYAALGFFGGDVNNGIYKSTDEGATWTKLTVSTLMGTGMGRITLAFAPNTTGSTAVIYAAIADPATGSNNLLGLFRSGDAGTTWTKLTSAPAFCNQQCWYDMAVGVQNASVVVVGGGAFTDNFTSLFESKDGGSTWTPSGTPGNPAPGNFANGSTTTHVHVDTHAIAFSANGATLYVGDDGGVWSTNTPTPAAGVSPTWSDLNAGLAITQFYPGPSAGIGDENYGFGGTQDNDTELFSGTLQWDSLQVCGDGGFTAIDNQIPTTVYTTCAPGSGPGLVSKSVFNGAVLPGPNSSFTAADTGINHGDRMQFIPPLTIDENGSNVLYFGTFQVYQTTDSAASWHSQSPDLTGGVGTITSIDVGHASSNNILVGTSNGMVWHTTDGGTTWTEMDNITPGSLPTRHVTAVRSERNDNSGNIAYVTFSGFGACPGCGATPGHVFKTTNGGTSWANISGDLPDIPVNNIIADRHGTFLALYIATDVGVFSCPDPEAATPCTNWTVVGDGLPNSPVLGLAMRRASRILRAATHGRSMWQAQLTDVSPPVAPALTSLTPAAAFAGDPTTQVTVTGVNFSTNTLVLFDGLSVGAPTYVNSTQLTISVSNTLLVDGHVFAVTLSDPAGVNAASLPFTVMNRSLTAPTMTPNSTTIYATVTLHFTGTNFVNSTAVTFNNVPLTGGTPSAGGTVFDVPVPVSLLTLAQPVIVTITNPLPGGGPTPPISFPFTINPQPSPLAIFNPSPIVLGPVNLNQTTAVLNVAIFNPGGAALNITAQSIGGTNAANFSFAAPLPSVSPSCNFPTSGQSGTSPATVTPGASCVFGITFTAGTPPGLAVSQATLSVTDNGVGNPQIVPILGVVNIPIVALTPLNFGAVLIGTSVTLNSTLLNSTNSVLTVNATGFTVSGTNLKDFVLGPAVSSLKPCPALASFMLAANASCDVGVTFKPSIAGNESAFINVADDGPGSPQSAPLLGSGFQVTSISPSVVATGGPAFTLTVNGGGFASSAVVNVDTSPRLTTFGNSTVLFASIPASDIATAGSRAITVTTPAGGVPSEPETLIVAQAPSATNDDIHFATSIVAGTTPFSITQDTTHATANTGGVNDPALSCASNSVARSVWFKYVPSATGRVVADTRYSSYTTILSAWTGAIGSLAPVAGACNSGNIPSSGAQVAESFVGFNVTAGTTYFLMVTDANANGSGGTLTFDLDFSSTAPANDDFNNAIDASAAPFTNTVNSIAATTDTGGRLDPTPSCAPAGAANSGKANSVWYKYVATASGTVTANTLTSPYDTILTVVTGSPGSFTSIACNDNANLNGNAATTVLQSQVSFGVSSGTTYFIMVSAVLGDGGTTNFHLTFTAGAPAPAVTFSPASISFGNQKVGTTSAQMSATLTNTGNANLSITGVSITGANMSDFTSSGTTCTNTTLLAPNANCALGATFTPAASGARSAAFTITDNASGSPHSLPLSGTGTVPVAALSPASIGFGNQTINTTSATSNVTVSNTGLASMNINSITLTGANLNQFKIVAPTTGTQCVTGANALAAGTSCNIGVQFAPTALGSQAASLSVADDAAGSPQTVGLTGTGVSAPAPAVTFSPTSISFGNQKVGTTSAMMSATLTNTGNANLNITGVSIMGTNMTDFTSSGTTCTNTTVLAQNANCILGATFTPSASGARSAAFTITDNAAGSPHSLPLSGTGTVPGVSLAPASVAFGNQRINTSSATTNATLTNNGAATLNITSITLTGTDMTQFTLGAPTTGSACPLGASQLAASASCSVGVKFAPTTTGAKSASVSLADDASGSPQTVPLTGTGTAPTASVAPTNIPFPNTRKGNSSAPTDVTVSNTGTDTLNIASITLTGANPTQFVLGAPSSGTPCSLSAATPVAPAANCKFSVKFAPTTTGAQAASVTITDDSGAVAGSMQTVTLSGTGTLPQASAAPNPLAFGNQRKGTTSAAMTVTLTNTGTDTLNLAAANAVAIGGANLADFSIVAATTTCKNSTAVPPAPGPGNSCDVNITFTPSTTGAEAASLTFTDDSGGVAGTMQVVSLTGTGVLPQGGAAPPTLAFGNQPQHVTSAPMTVTLTNSGTDTLNLAAANAVAVSGPNMGDFAVVAATTTCKNSTALAPAPGPGNTCVINITFTPSTTMAESATLTITDDSGGVAGSTQTVALTGTGTTATVALAPSPANFTNQRTGTTSAPMTITLTNSGGAAVHLAAATPVTFSGGNASDFAIVPGTTTCTAGATIGTTAPNNTCVINITFTPGATGARATTLNVADDAPGSPQLDTLNGTGIFPAVTLTPNTPLAFGNQIITTTSPTQTVILKNTGTDTLNLAGVNAVALGGVNAAEFTTAGTTCTNGLAIAVNGTCNIVVAFAPATTGVKSATVTITDDVTPAQVINLGGTGVTAPTATLSTANLTFAAQRTGTTSAAQTVTVTNSGGADLNIATVALAGTNSSDFAISPGTTCTNSSTVKGGASNTCIINVTFTPSAVGARGPATITITDNADATGVPGANQTITLNGTGKAPAVTFVPAAVPNFGNQRIGTSSAASNVTITNSGTDTLNFTSITVTGANSVDFTVAGSGATPCPTGVGALNASTSCGIAITFKPTATGARAASVAVADDASGSPQMLALAGTGTAPGVTLSAASITFPVTAVGSTSAAQSATVTNSGTATLTMGSTAVAISGTNAGDFAIAAGTTCTNNASVAVGANCAINFTFKPAAAGVRTATATITDDAGGAPGSSTTQIITLNGSTPSTANVSPATLTFAAQGVNTASSAQTITITNNGGVKLNLAANNAVAISGTNASDFAVASGTTCTNGSSVVGSGATCVINITFTPAATGARGPATVTITDDAGGVANSTQTVTLNGTGIDFTLNVTAGSQTVKAGSPATFTFTVTPGGNGFPNAINFSTSALPRGAMATFSPATLNPPITAQQTVTLMISTTSRGAAPPTLPAPQVPPLVVLFRTLAVFLVLAAFLMMRRGLRTRRLATYLPLGLVLLALAVSAGCVGGNANGTPAGMTQVTINATAGSLTHTTTVNLTVQ